MFIAGTVGYEECEHRRHEDSFLVPTLHSQILPGNKNHGWFHWKHDLPALHHSQVFKVSKQKVCPSRVLIHLSPPGQECWSHTTLRIINTTSLTWTQKQNRTKSIVDFVSTVCGSLRAPEVVRTGLVYTGNLGFIVIESCVCRSGACMLGAWRPQVRAASLCQWPSLRAVNSLSWAHKV